MDADTKFLVSWQVGRRNFETAAKVMEDVAARMASRIQLTTDGMRVFVDAVDWAFSDEIDYAQLVKLYGSDPDPDAGRRYTIAKVTGIRKEPVSGSPSNEYISTSYVERQNLNFRMGMRRLTRLTNGFSKKVENLEHALAIHVMHHNLVRVHRTLRTTPAMALGIEDHVWTIEELVGLLEGRLSGI